MKQELLFPDEWKYKVSINCGEPQYACTEKEAWEIIGNSPFGSTYWVYDKQGNFPSEFVPF